MSPQQTCSGRQIILSLIKGKNPQVLENNLGTTTFNKLFCVNQFFRSQGKYLRTQMLQTSGLSILAFNVVLLTSCTTVQVIVGSSVQVERYFGFPVVNIQGSENALTAVRLQGTGIMVSDSNFILGHVDDFTVRQDLTKSNGNCSMIVLIEDEVNATELLQELRLNRNKYAGICAVHINSERNNND